jgi:hypothetical protein
VALRGDGKEVVTMGGNSAVLFVDRVTGHETRGPLRSKKPVRAFPRAGRIERTTDRLERWDGPLDLPAPFDEKPTADGQRRAFDVERWVFDVERRAVDSTKRASISWRRALSPWKWAFHVERSTFCFEQPAIRSSRRAFFFEQRAIDSLRRAIPIDHCAYRSKHTPFSQSKRAFNGEPMPVARSEDRDDREDHTDRDCRRPILSNDSTIDSNE